MEIEKPVVPENKLIKYITYGAILLVSLEIIGILPVWTWWVVFAIIGVPVAYFAYYGFQQDCKAYAWLRIGCYLLLIPLILLIYRLNGELESTKAMIANSPKPTADATSSYVWYTDPVSWLMIFLIGSLAAVLVLLIYSNIRKTKTPRLHAFMHKWSRFIITGLFLIALAAMFFIMHLD